MAGGVLVGLILLKAGFLGRPSAMQTRKLPVRQDSDASEQAGRAKDKHFFCFGNPWFEPRKSKL
jgi:hypothetical protein